MSTFGSIDSFTKSCSAKILSLENLALYVVLKLLLLIACFLSFSNCYTVNCCIYSYSEGKLSFT